MKSISSLLLLPLVLAAKPPQERLAELAQKNNGVIPLDATTFELITGPKRTWSASIQLTAMDPRRRCGPCKEFDPSWKTVAEAWSTVPAKHRDTHFFGTLDFDNAQAVFQKLNLATAPVVMIYPATEGPRQLASGKTGPSKYEFSQGFDPLPLAQHLNSHTPVPIPFKAPIDWNKYATIAFGFLAFATFLRYAQPVLQSRFTWGIITVISIVVFTSGFMFNRIRNTPWAGPKGASVAAGFQTQYAQETQMVGMIYGTLAASFAMLIFVTPYTKSSSRQRVQVYIWNAVIIIVYSILVSLFKIKNKAYPFKLFL
ncbi:oligosaccharyl transferase subunit OST3/OST6 family [Pterulicium gracile]|uniref:Oligosaccharyl transferase subunit OST3/OST6 family n=1 Tax=Pterulicium gracile TaxID=1884261 RepID=A0A5C3R026_9AGAR|nr:oligosaccharyl transferase subunit OST3/OST6 family [Pterula gracilis]